MMRKDESGRLPSQELFRLRGLRILQDITYTDEVYGYRGFVVVSELLCGDVHS